MNTKKTNVAKPARSSAATKAKTPVAPSKTAKKPSGAFRTVSNHKIFGAPHSGARYAVHYSTKPFEVSSFQRINNLESGLYTLRAWVKSSGGLVSTMSVSDFDHSKTRRSVSIPKTSEWKQIEIKDIKVISGKCAFAFQSKSPGHKWMAFDDVEFYRQTPDKAAPAQPAGNV